MSKITHLIIDDDKNTFLSKQIDKNTKLEIIKEINSEDFLNYIKKIDSYFNSGFLPINLNSSCLLNFKLFQNTKKYIILYPKGKHKFKMNLTEFSDLHYNDESDEFKTFELDYPYIIVDVVLINDVINIMNVYQTYNIDLFTLNETKLYRLCRPNVFENCNFCIGNLSKEGKTIKNESIPFLIDIIDRILWKGIANNDLTMNLEEPYYYYGREIYSKEIGIDINNINENEYNEFLADNQYNDFCNSFKAFYKIFLEKKMILPEKYAYYANLTLGELINGNIQNI